VIHCLGPVYGRDEPADALLASCYREALLLADARALGSVAFPAISTGIFGYPAEEAARVALRTVVELAPALAAVRRVRFVLYDQRALEVHHRALAEAAQEIGLERGDPGHRGGGDQRGPGTLE
jgi:O-acetyl-ADP-ribose deacetylase (regulator of RNase III)